MIIRLDRCWESGNGLPWIQNHSRSGLGALEDMPAVSSIFNYSALLYVHMACPRVTVHDERHALVIWLVWAKGGKCNMSFGGVSKRPGLESWNLTHNVIYKGCERSAASGWQEI